MVGMATKGLIQLGSPQNISITFPLRPPSQEIKAVRIEAKEKPRWDLVCRHTVYVNMASQVKASLLSGYFIHG